MNDDTALADDVITDAELTALALAADPDQVLGPDAVAISLGDDPGAQLLPEWYMPAARSGRAGRGRATIIGVVILASLLVNAAGLCVTYGFPEIAW